MYSTNSCIELVCINFFPKPAPQLLPGLRSHSSCSIRMTKLQTSLGHALGLNGHLDAVPAIAQDPADVPYRPGWWLVVKWRLMVISTVWEMVSNFPTTSQLVVDYAEYHMAFWKVLNDVRLIYMLSGCFGAQALSWFTAVIHQLKHVWLHPCHPRSKNVVPQTLGIFTNLVRFPLPKWVSRRFCQHTSNISKFQPIPFCFFCQFTTSTYTFSETGYHVYLSRGVPLFRGSRHPCCHGLDAFRLHVVLSIHCLHLRPWKLQGREKKNRKQTTKNPASIHVPSIKMT